jgi:hypothetical protein
MDTVALILFLLAWALAILGGLGVGGMGRDSRRFNERGHSQDRDWRSLLSR